MKKKATKIIDNPVRVISIIGRAEFAKQQRAQLQTAAFAKK